MATKANTTKTTTAKLTVSIVTALAMVTAKVGTTTSAIKNWFTNNTAGAKGMLGSKNNMATFYHAFMAHMGATIQQASSVQHTLVPVLYYNNGNLYTQFVTDAIHIKINGKATPVDTDAKAPFKVGDTTYTPTINASTHYGSNSKKYKDFYNGTVHSASAPVLIKIGLNNQVLVDLVKQWQAHLKNSKNYSGQLTPATIKKIVNCNPDNVVKAIASLA